MFSIAQITVSVGSRRATCCKDYSYSQTKSVTDANLCHNVRFLSLKRRERSVCHQDVHMVAHLFHGQKKTNSSCPNLLTMIFNVCNKKEPPVFEALTCRCVSTECPLLCCYVSTFEDWWLFKWYIFHLFLLCDLVWRRCFYIRVWPFTFCEVLHTYNFVVLCARNTMVLSH